MSRARTLADILTAATSMATDTETAAAITSHASESDPHTGYILESLIDAKGDLIVGSADNTPSKVSVGTDGYLLAASSAAASGVAWVAPSSADITGVTAGTGLSGGGTSGDVTLSIDSTVATLTGTQTLTGKTISGTDNTLSNIGNSSLTNSAITINGTSTSLGGTYTNASASTSAAGIVQLEDSTSSTSTTKAATPNAVKSAYDLANGAIQKTLTTTTGDIIYASSANTPARLGIGSSSQVLTVSGGVPTWAAPSSVTWGPAFVAYRATSNQSISGGTATKMQLDATILNVGSCYDAATNYRFTPNVAGYYQVNLSTEIQFVDGSGYTMLYKNGSRYTSFRNYHTNAGASLMSGGSVIMYMNGTTDYVEAYVYAQTSTAYVSGHDGTDSGHFSASFVRGV